MLISITDRWNCASAAGPAKWGTGGCAVSEALGLESEMCLSRVILERRNARLRPMRTGSAVALLEIRIRTGVTPIGGAHSFAVPHDYAVSDR
jgi:hypothetical protein